MAFQLFDEITGQARPLTVREPRVLCVQVDAFAQGDGSLDALRARCVLDVLTRHATSLGMRVVPASEGDGCDVRIGTPSPADVAGEGTLWLGVGPVLATTGDGPATAPRLDTVGQALSEQEPEVVRALMLSVQAREPLPLSCEPDAEGGVGAVAPLEAAEQRVTYLYATMQRLDEIPAERVVDVDSKAPPSIAGFPAALAGALDAGLDTPRALAESERFLRAVNELCDGALRKRGKLIRSHREDARAGLAALHAQLGLGGERPAAFLERLRDRRVLARGIPQRLVEKKIRERLEARARGDYARADALRDEIVALGVEILDGPHGTSWKVP